MTDTGIVAKSSNITTNLHSTPQLFSMDPRCMGLAIAVAWGRSTVAVAIGSVPTSGVALALALGDVNPYHRMTGDRAFQSS